MSSSSLEHRVFHRLAVQLPVFYRIVSDRDGKPPVFSRGSTVNLSAGGMLLTVDEITPAVMSELLEGRGTIEVRFATEGSEASEVLLPCRLVWMQAPARRGERWQLGLKFVDVEAELRERLRRFVRACSQ